VRLTKALIVGVAFVVVACTGATTTEHRQPLSDQQATYHDPAGWSVDIPPGWQTVPFDTSTGDATAHGALISNVGLPSPSMNPGYPIQTNGRDLPPDGIALVIAVDVDPNDSQQPPFSPPFPPLTLDGFTKGSAPAGSGTLDSLWFSGNGQVFIATIKTGPEARSADLKTLARVVSSLRLD